MGKSNYTESIFNMLVYMEGALSWMDIMLMPYSHFTEFIKLRDELQKAKEKQLERSQEQQQKNMQKLEAKQKQLQTQSRIKQGKQQQARQPRQIPNYTKNK